MKDTTKEIAKAVTAAAELLKPLVTVPCRLLENIANEPTKELGGLFGDRVRAWRTENARRTAELAAQKLNERQLLDATVPIGFLGPALEHAANVDEPELQELWAELITNGAADGENQQPRYIQTLSGMSAADAKVFEDYAKADAASLFVRRGKVGAASWEQNVAGERLHSLGLLEPTNPGGTAMNAVTPEEIKAHALGQRDHSLRISNYGRQFARAVGIAQPTRTVRHAVENVTARGKPRGDEHES